MESPTIAQIAGTHIQAYESLYKQVDPNSSNYIKAIEAANFLKKSGLSQSTLGKIWDLSDPNGRGFLDKRSLFIALKLIALVQNGRQPTIADLTLNILPPKMGEQIDWSISPIDRNKYTDLFSTLNPVDSKLAGNKMKPIMINSKLPVDILTKIWDLSDTDQDGFLDLQEFILAMHLISKAKENVVLPSILPIELSNFKRKSSQDSWSAFDSPMPVTNQLSSTLNADISFKNSFKSGLTTWIVSATDKAKYDELFQTLDKDFDGYVTGVDVKDTLVQSGLPQNILAHIWNLCDLKENGKLNSEQFALAMYFIKQNQSGIDLPLNLSPQMVPPTLRPKPLIGIDNHALDSNNTQLSNTNGSSNLSTLQSTGNKELDALAEELKELQIEKLKLESEVNGDEAGIKLKQSDIKNLQNEIEALHQMLKQLDTQKSEARKRLEDLGAQNKLLESTLHDLNQTLKEEKVKVENLTLQLNEQKVKVDIQESELLSKRKELEDLRSEETKLELKLDSYKREAETASKNAGDTQLEISHIRTKLMELEEYERRLNDAITDIDSAISSNDVPKINHLLPRTITPPLVQTQNTVKQNGINAFESDPFGQKPIVFKTSSDFVSDPFAGEDPFKEDPFKSEDRVTDAFATESFANFGSHEVSHEAFDPFGTGSFTSDKTDPFGSDPFSSQTPNPSVRSESPTPALPPKKSKAPPPRPAPPKHANKAPLRAAPAPPITSSSEDAFKSDSFGSNQASFDPFNDSKDPFSSSGTASSNSFANFANFDKCEMPLPVDPYATLASIHAESQLISNTKSSNTSTIHNFEDSHFIWAFKENI